MIVEAIGALTDEEFTESGLPRVEVLEVKTELVEISAEERNEAWERFQAEVAAEGESPDEETPSDPVEGTDKGEPTEPEPEPPKPVKPVKAVKAVKAEVTPKVAEDEPEAVKAPYVVVEGKAVTSRKGILGPGQAAWPKYFGPDGDKILKDLEDKGMVVKT